MARYLLSTHRVEGAARPAMTAEEMQELTGKVRTLEAEMKSAGALLFGGRLHPPDTATVVRVSEGRVMTTDGPFVESKEHLGEIDVSREADQRGHRSAGLLAEDPADGGLIDVRTWTHPRTDAPRSVR
jgi:hypothetical protein